MTTGVFAWMLWRMPVGMWTQVPGLASTRVVAQRQLRLALEEVQDGGHRGGVFGQLLALAEAEDHRLDPVVVVQGAAQDALVGRLDLLRQIADVRVGVVIAEPPPSSVQPT